jgi:hypothetical protein
MTEQPIHPLLIITETGAIVNSMAAYLAHIIMHTIIGFRGVSPACYHGSCKLAAESEYKNPTIMIVTAN